MSNKQEPAKEQQNPRDLLPDNEYSFRLLFEHSLDAVLITDEQGRYLAVNNAAVELFGYSKEQLLQMSVSDLKTPDGSGQASEKFNVYLTNGIERGEFRFIRTDGQHRIAEYTACKFAPHRHLSILRDITERKILEGAHQNLLTMEQSMRSQAELSEQHHRFLAEAMPHMVWTATTTGQIDYLNQRWFIYTGLNYQQSQGDGWQQVLHPADSGAFLQLWQESLHSGAVFQMEQRLRRADGNYRWHLSRAVPIRNDYQQITKWLGTATDIDDQKRSEQGLRFLAEASAILASSLDYKTTLTNVAQLAVPTMADWCAVDIVEEDQSVRRLAAVHTDPNKLELAYELQRRYPYNPNDPHGLANVLRTGEPEFVPVITDEMLTAAITDTQLLKMLQELGLISSMIVPLRVRGRVLGAVSFVNAESGRHYTTEDLALAMDLSYRAALAVDNARLYRESQDANRVKEEFLATISHELRTPLTAMLGWTRLLRSGKLDTVAFERAVDTIERNAKAQAQLIEDLLDISRIISGKLRLEAHPILVEPIVESVINSLMLTAGAKSLQLETHIEPNIGQILGDPNRLQQIVWNLLSNAIKFTPEHGRVAVQVQQSRGQIEIVVSDSGQGIAKEFLPYVFERFRQADSTSTRRHGGLGLGLAIVRNLVELHGGTITVDSPGVGQGAIFTVRLPLLATQVTPVRSERRSIPADTLPEPQLEGVKVLIVDDEPDTRELLAVVLRSSNAIVETASCVADAFKLLDQWLPDVIVSDIGMPEEDGYQFISKLRLRPPADGGKIPALALTAYARSEDRRRALRCGFQMHLPKPVEPAELITVIDSLRDRK